LLGGGQLRKSKAAFLYLWDPEREGRPALGVFVAALLTSLLLFGSAAAEPTKDDIRTSQQALQSLGYNPGTADGAMGARTKAAIKKFQRQEGLPVTGELDQATMHALGFPDATASSQTQTTETTGNGDTGSPGVAFIVLLIVGGLVFAFIKSGKKQTPYPSKTSRAPNPTPKPTNTFGKRTAPQPQNTGLDVHVSPAVRPAPQSPSGSTVHSEPSLAVPLATDIENAAMPRKPQPGLSATTTQSIADHNQRVAAAIAGAAFADPRKRIVAALADRAGRVATGDLPLHGPVGPAKSEPTIILPMVESSPRLRTPGLGLSPETAKSIAEHNKAVAESIGRSSLARHNEGVSAWVATHRPSPEVETAVKADAISMMPRFVEQPHTQLKMGAKDYYWIRGDQAVSIGTIQIPNGMLYVGTKLLAPQGHVENCLINPSLPVASSNPDTAGQTMPYWPTYTTISPECRLAYLQWLSGGKRDPGAYIGYVFLYFYGLERRLMLDDPGDEAPLLIAEVERLLCIYGVNHSLRGYATRLLEAAKFKFGNVSDEAAPALGQRENELPLSIRAGIGRMLAYGKTISADWMLAWYAATPGRYMSRNATRCEKEFIALFRKRFAEKYPDGMKITPPRRRLTCTYQAASATFSLAIQSQATNLPDIVALSAPLTALDPLIGSCTDDLDAYSRLIGRDPESRNTVRAAALLPIDLDTGEMSAPLADLTAFLEQAAKAPAATLSLDTLLTKLAVKTTDKGRIPKAELAMMSDALGRCGFAIEPDPLSAGSVLNGADKVILFKAQGGAKIDPTKPSYLAARALIDIGALIATADGVFSEEEVHAIESEIARDPELNTTERTRLLAYLAFLSKNPPTPRILSRFKDLPLEKRQALAQLAVAVAGADGRLAPEEVKLLEKAYRTLGLPEASLYSDLQTFAASDDDLPTVIPADREPSVAIPRPAATAKTVRLDAARLARTRSDTAKVSAILSTVFAEDSANELDEMESNPPANDEESIPIPLCWDVTGLTTPCVRLLNALKGYDSISEAEFAALAQKENLLAGGAIETINDWALEKFDEPLIDEGDPIEIAFHLLIENKQDAA
jgi:peptidoglycan hydrolase-like protein with peptidoglycan-binding domain/tellurite resistance protein